MWAFCEMCCSLIHAVAIQAYFHNDWITWEARTCCWRWNGKAEAPGSPWDEEAITVSMLFTPAAAPETEANKGLMPVAMLENAPPMANWLGWRSRGWEAPKGLKNCCPLKPGGNPRFCRWAWFRWWELLSVCTVKGGKCSFECLVSSSLCDSLVGLFRSSTLRTLPLEEICAGLCLESGEFFSVLVEEYRDSFDGLLISFRCSVLEVVVEILGESPVSGPASSLLSSSLSPSLSHRPTT